MTLRERALVGLDLAGELYASIVCSSMPAAKQLLELDSPGNQKGTSHSARDLSRSAAKLFENVHGGDVATT